jgi:hypothetical protein
MPAQLRLHIPDRVPFADGRWLVASAGRTVPLSGQLRMADCVCRAEAGEGAALAG